MALSDTTKKLQEAAASKELQKLREMRKTSRLHTAEALEKRLEEIDRFSQTAEGQTEEGQEKICRLMAEWNRDNRKAKLCRATLGFAERAERKTKGGAEAFMKRNAERIRRVEAWIERQFGEEKQFQLMLKE
jgi:hypothetical protein